MSRRGMPAISHRILFARHGETRFNAEDRLQGQRDIPLNARGRDQAQALGRTLRARVGAEIDRLEAGRGFVASPLLRARETMELMRAAMGLAPERYRLEPALKELSFGVWEGLTWDEIRALDPKGLKARFADKWDFTPPGGESYATLADRVRPWLKSLAADAFVVAHGGVARAFLTILADMAPALAVDTPITQGRAIMFEKGTWRWIE